MLARVARAASVSMTKRASFAAPALSAFQSRGKSSLTSLLKREIEEEKGNCFEGEELEELHAKMNKIFTLKETPGNMEIVLTGQVGADSIRIKFDSQDVIELEEDYVDEDEENEEEEANYDEEEEEEDGEEDELPGIRFVADVTRDNKGLQFECVASSNLTVERVRFLNDFSADAEKDNLYFGPNFADMELDVQEKFYDYLAERKIDDDLAQFITQYADLKEQREYLSFLESAKAFIKN
ncbi:Mitochondrial glyco protein, partial [Globisporangium splendens]